MVRRREQDIELRERALKVIPKGVYGHMSTARLPANYPQFFNRAKGARIWDADDNEYVDFMCAYGPNLLGYGFEPVEQAAAAQQALGDALTGPSPLFVELAEQFVGMVSHADWAMFCKNGSDATTMALMTARAHTGRQTVLVAEGAYHGASPWSTPRPAGVIATDRAKIVTYAYNDPESLQAAFDAHADDLAGIFATPYRHEIFADQEALNVEYARLARELCDRSGALLIVDDVRAGFRITRDCSWAASGVAPDLSAWGKCFANGYPISALLGAEKARAAAGEIYVTGSFWFSATAMAAALETLKQIRETDYLERLIAAGQSFRDGLQQQASAHGFTLRQTGPAQMPQILFEDDPDFRIGYGWNEECVERGVYLHPFHNMFLSSAHTEADIRQALAATDEAFGALKRRRASLTAPVQNPAILGRAALAALAR